MDSLTENFFSLHLWIADSAARHANQGGYRNPKNGKERRLAAHIALYLKPHIGAKRHPNGHSEGEPAYSLGNLRHRQDIASQRHRRRTTYGIHNPHVQANDDEQAKDRKCNKRGK